MDEKRQRYAQENKKTLKIEAIEFSWIFDQRRCYQFLKYLSTTDSIKIFDNKTIRHILSYMWLFYSTQIFWKVFVPYFAFFVFFLIFVTWMDREDCLLNDFIHNFHETDVSV